MPYFQYTINLRTGEELKFIRLIEVKDIDQVWRKYHLKAKEHYKKRLTNFRVIQLSKLDPDVKAWVAAQGKQDTNLMNDLLSEFGTTSPTANRKKKPGTEGPTLEDRK